MNKITNKMNECLLKVLLPLMNKKAFGDNETKAAFGGWNIVLVTLLLVLGLVIVVATVAFMKNGTVKLTGVFDDLNGLF